MGDLRPPTEILRLLGAIWRAGRVSALAACGSLAWAVVVGGGGALLRAVACDALGEGVAVDAERGGRAREVLLVARERLLDVELLELFEGLVEHDLAVEHLVYQGFEPGAHRHGGSLRPIR